MLHTLLMQRGSPCQLAGWVKESLGLRAPAALLLLNPDLMLPLCWQWWRGVSQWCVRVCRCVCVCVCVCQVGVMGQRGCGSVAEGTGMYMEWEKSATGIEGGRG